MAVTGAAALGGSLQVSLSPGFVPDPGIVFDVLTCASRTGTFATISLPPLPTDRTWVTTYNGGATAGLRLSVETVAPPEFTLNYAAGANGSISGATSQTVVQGRNATPVTAIPNSGYQFVSWSDGVPTATRTDTNIQANLSVTANFAIIQYSVAYAAGPNGSISGNTSQTVNNGSNATTVTAIPNNGYQFVSWSDGVLTATRTDTNIQANLSVTANFGLGAYAAWISAFPTITNPDDRLPEADPDKDGLANSVEFVTGSNPSLPTGGNVVSADIDGSNVVFEFERVKSAGEAGFASFIEVSGTLNPGSWTTPSGGQVVVTDHGTTETVTVTVPAPPEGRMFGRIRVTSP